MKRLGVGDFKITSKMKQYVNDVLDTERLSYGPYSRKFESMLSSQHGAKFGVLSNSGTSSLQVSLQAMKEIHGWSDGDEVIVPAVTFVATINIILHNRMMPVLVDVDPYSYNIDVELIGQAITDKTRAIIPVHLFGQPADMRGIKNVLEDEGATNVKIIEDVCECMLATHYGKSVGSIGDIGCFSTYVAHIVTTGVGGVSITNNAAYAAKMRSLVNHGRDNIYTSIDDDIGLEIQELKEVIGRRFNFESVGHSFRATELEAAIGVAQLEGDRLVKNIEARQKNADLLTKGLGDLDDWLRLPHISEGNTHSFMMYPIVLEHGDYGGKWEVCNFLETLNIETREMLPITDQPVYKHLFNPAHYPIADWINHNGFYVGCHPGLTERDINKIVSTFYAYISNGSDR